MIKLLISEIKSNTSPQYIYSPESLEVVDCLSACWLTLIFFKKRIDTVWWIHNTLALDIKSSIYPFILIIQCNFTHLYGKLRFYDSKSQACLVSYRKWKTIILSEGNHWHLFQKMINYLILSAQIRSLNDVDYSKLAKQLGKE